MHGRKFAFVGRSMVRNMGVARDLGLLRVAPGLMVGLDEATSMPPEQVVLISTGSQGEPLSALGRMARGEHHQVTIEAGDTIVLASSLVPGNETAVYKVINGLARLGATVVHKETARVHVSGHAPAGELRTLLNVAKPRHLMPVHGEWRHLRAHAALAEETGMAGDRVLLRSEEHTSELQSRPYLVCRLLLEKKKKPITANDSVSAHRRLPDTPYPSCHISSPCSSFLTSIAPSSLLILPSSSHFPPPVHPPHL